MCSKTTKTAGLLRNKINNLLLVYLSLLRHTHKQACNQNFAKEGAWKLNVLCFKNALIAWQAEQSGATHSSPIDGRLRAKPLLLGDFLRKNNNFNTILITFCTVLKLFERIKLLRLKTSIKIKLPIPFSPYFTYVTGLFKKMLKPVAHSGGGFGSRTPPLELKKQQHNFVDITQFVILCHIYFSLNNYLSCC